MRILHLGDFHYKSKNAFEQRKVVAKLIEHLKTMEKIDVVYFTGDLVFSGEKFDDFESAHEILFLEIINNLKIKKENIIISPGNHDINRVECSDVFLSYFHNGKSIYNNESLNEFCALNTKDFESSLTSSENFTKYLKKHFCNENDNCSSLYSSHIREIGDLKIGTISVNSAWISSGYYLDKNNLLFPTSFIKEAISNLKDCQLKVFIQHHPLHYYKEFNYIEIQNLVHQNFDLLFSGHLHKEEISTSYNGTNGIYCNTTEATLTFDRNGEIGYSIINIDINDKSTLKKERGIFIQKENKFIDIESVIINVPCGEEKHKQNRFRQKIISKYNTELENANELLLSYDNEESNHNFLESFTDPLLSDNSDTEAAASDKVNYIPFENILNVSTNYLLFGKDKCGKTSLLKKVQLQCLKNYSQIGLIPFYFDYKDWEKKNNNIDIVKIVAQYYELNYKDSLSIVESGKFVFLIDNLNTQVAIHSTIVEFLEKYNVKFIVCSEYIASRVYSTSILDNLYFEKLFFKNLTRKEIRLYTEKQPSIRIDDKDLVTEKITNFCKQLQLPLNYWTISIIIMIYKKSSDDYSKNLFGILDACVDEILLKKKLAFTKTSLTFDQYKEICSQIAYYLLVKHRESVYSASALELIQFIDSYKGKNPRIIGDSKDIFDFLVETGIIKRKGDDKYTFRLNGIFEYFLAFYLNENPDFIEDLLVQDSIYLSFKNELEIYTGFNRKDEVFLNKIYDKTKTVFNPIIDFYSKNNSIDNILCGKIGEANEFSKSIKKLMVKNPISPLIQDQISDELSPLDTNSDVHLKEAVDISHINFEVLENYISILARVFKNSDRVRNLELVYSIFDYLIESYCFLGFKLIDEIEEHAKNENLKLAQDENEDVIIGEEILKLISRFIPILIQVMLYDGIGHINFREIILSKIEELKKDKKNNQYKLFLLYFLLIDTDINSNKEYVDDVFENVNLGVLKLSTLIKLNYYLAFKSHRNKVLEQFFRNKIQKASFLLDNKTDINELQRLLSKKKKQSIMRERLNK